VTLSIAGYFLAVLVAVGGALIARRMPRQGARLAVGTAAVVLAVAIGWFSWLIGTSA
jgi:hypothetical protein